MEVPAVVLLLVYNVEIPRDTDTASHSLPLLSNLKQLVNGINRQDSRKISGLFNKALKEEKHPRRRRIILSKETTTSHIEEEALA